MHEVTVTQTTVILILIAVGKINNCDIQIDCNRHFCLIDFKH